MFVWDVKQVLDFVKEKFGDSNQLSNKELSLKSTILFTLSTWSRISALHILELYCYIRKSSFWREENQTSQLLVSFIKPDNAVA